MAIGKAFCPFWPQQSVAVAVLDHAILELGFKVNDVYEEREHQPEMRALLESWGKFEELWRKTLKMLKAPSTSAAHAKNQQTVFDAAGESLLSQVETWRRIDAVKPKPYPARPKPPPGHQAI